MSFVFESTPDGHFTCQTVLGPSGHNEPVCVKNAMRNACAVPEERSLKNSRQVTLCNACTQTVGNDVSVPILSIVPESDFCVVGYNCVDLQCSYSSLSPLAFVDEKNSGALELKNLSWLENEIQMTKWDATSPTETHSNSTSPTVSDAPSQELRTHGFILTKTSYTTRDGSINSRLETYKMNRPCVVFKNTLSEPLGVRRKTHSFKFTHSPVNLLTASGGHASPVLATPTRKCAKRKYTQVLGHDGTPVAMAKRALFRAGWT
jgi:hypothetical protein